jgi:hypothetical protein
MLYFMKFKILSGNFCGFYEFFYFSARFHPIWMKKYQNLDKHQGYMSTVSVRSCIGPNRS